jgi:hypothetical protein
VSRALLVLANKAIREKAARWVAELPEGTRVTFQEPKRTLPQNARMWASLTDISTQVEHFGRRYPTDTWKCIFLHALGRETQFVPSLDGNDSVAIGQSSSDLSVREMADLLEVIYAFGAANGVVFQEPLRQDPREAA